MVIRVLALLLILVIPASAVEWRIGGSGDTTHFDGSLNYAVDLFTAKDCTGSGTPYPCCTGAGAGTNCAGFAFPNTTIDKLFLWGISYGIAVNDNEETFFSANTFTWRTGGRTGTHQMTLTENGRLVGNTRSGTAPAEAGPTMGIDLYRATGLAGILVEAAQGGQTSQLQLKTVSNTWTIGNIENGGQVLRIGSTSVSNAVEISPNGYTRLNKSGIATTAGDCTSTTRNRVFIVDVVSGTDSFCVCVNNDGGTAVWKCASIS
jgi:hypothetical protein